MYTALVDASHLHPHGISFTNRSPKSKIIPSNYFLPNSKFSSQFLLSNTISSISQSPISRSRAIASRKTPLQVQCSSDRTNQQKINVLVIGSGGREHALCYALTSSPSTSLVYCAPGNAGIQSSNDATCVPQLNVSDSQAVIQFCTENSISLVIVGPEAPLVAGLADDLSSHESPIPVFGPSAEAAQLEGSKSFMKNICDKYNIPTAKYATFTDPDLAKAYIRSQGVPIVVKADGLAAGKGVVVAQTLEEAISAVDSILVQAAFGSAGGQIVIEEFLKGEEVSFFALVDGTHALPIGSAQDHKAVGDGDVGPNTGGMGAYSPASPSLFTKEMEEYVMRDIVGPTVRGMAAEGCPFVGVLYAGLMVDGGRAKLLEYNVRFGDPECQVLIMRLKSDLVPVLLAACKGELKDFQLDWREESALVVVLAAKGYPGPYGKGSLIGGLDTAQEAGGDKVKIFHAGTVFNDDGKVVAAGGRVLGVAALGNDVSEAQKRAYAVVDQIDWPEGFCRRDIGWRAIARLNSKEK